MNKKPVNQCLLFYNQQHHFALIFLSKEIKREMFFFLQRISSIKTIQVFFNWLKSSYVYQSNNSHETYPLIRNYHLKYTSSLIDFVNLTCIGMNVWAELYILYSHTWSLLSDKYLSSIWTPFSAAVTTTDNW